MKYPVILVLSFLALLLAACGDNNDNQTKTVVKTVSSNTSTVKTNTTTVTSTTEVTAQGGNDLTARKFFSADSPWNTRTDALNVDAESATLISKAKQRVGVVERDNDLPPRVVRRTINDGLFINTTQWTVPIVTGGPVTRVTCRQKICGDNKDLDSLPIPSEINPDPKYDGWFSVIVGNTAYDMWRARREKDGTISYQFIRKWDLNGKGFNPPNTVSARGSGLPLVAGVIRPNELRQGIIDHALAISVPGPAQRNYVQPASVTDGNGELTSLPEGARIRLKTDRRAEPPIDPVTGKPVKWTRQQRRTADALTAALRTYGAIVVDRSAVPTLYAQKDAMASLLAGNELQNLKLDDFEVMTLGEIYKDPPASTRQVERNANLDTNSITVTTTTTTEDNNGQK